MECCISNPPFNLKWQIPPFASIQSRFVFADVPPESNANYTFILTALDKCDKAVFILPNGVLTTGTSEEAKIRKILIENNFIEAVILCPDKMFESTQIGVCILMLNKNKQNTTITFIDARNMATTEEREQKGQFGGKSHTNRAYKKTINTFSDETIEKIASAIREKSNIAGFSAAATLEDVRSQDYLLMPSRYVEFESIENKTREYKDIVKDINEIIREKNKCKLTINETLAKAIGFDINLYKNDSESKEFDELIERLSGEKIVKNNYFTITKNKNEIKFENADKDEISSILMMIMQNWKQHIYYLNQRENIYLAELRDKLLPDLMEGKIDVTQEE